MYDAKYYKVCPKISQLLRALALAPSCMPGDNAINEKKLHHCQQGETENIG